MCARALATPSCSGFTIDQIGGIMSARARSICPQSHPSPSDRQLSRHPQARRDRGRGRLDPRQVRLNFNLMVSLDCEPTSDSRLRCSGESLESFLMSNRALNIAIALLIVLTPPAASFAARGTRGVARGFARPAGSAGTGNVPISGIPRGPANAGGMNNAAVDPSGVGNASRMATLPQPHIAAPTPPGGSRNPAAPPSMNLDQQSLPEAPTGHRQPRADQVPSENDLMNPNDPMNQENAALDRMIKGICRGC
jgi:hypothetical protein